MKELKIKNLWAVDINNVQWDCFKYKKEAIEYAFKSQKNKRMFSFVIVKRKVLTDKY
jgi:hypothetical protein